MSYALGVWRHRWLALAVAWVAALAGWAYVWQMPEYYAARARLFVDTNSVLRPLMQGLAITPDVDERIALMSRTLLSRPNMEKLGRMTDLDLQVTDDAQKNAMIQRLQRSVTLQAERGNNSLYNIEVTDRNPELARRIAQSLITVFIESSLNDNRADSSDARSFLDQQIEQSEQRLVEAESRLARFKQRNVDTLPGQGGDYYSRLERARADLAGAQLELRELENRRDDLQRQLSGEVPLVPGSAAVETPFDERIQMLAAQLDGLLSRYTERHPEVRQLRGLISDLESEREQFFARLRAAPGAGQDAFSESPVYQGMRTMQAETDARIAEMRVRVAEYQQRVEALEDKVNLIPEVEAQLAQLNRDYDVLSKQHEELLERRESARISGDVESNAGDVTFRVIDPPFVPSKPAEPNKPLLNALVLLVAVGAGVGSSLLLSMVYPVINDARMLAMATGLPLLGAVTFNKSPAQRRSDRWRLAGFSACVLVFIATFAGVLVAPRFIA